MKNAGAVVFMVIMLVSQIVLAAPSASVRFLQGSVTFAGVNEGRSFFRTTDPFFRNQNVVSRAAKMQTQELISQAEFMRHRRAAVVSWSAEEIEEITDFLRQFEAAVYKNQINLRFPENVLFIKTNGTDEAHACYTLGNAVIFTEYLLRRLGRVSPAHGNIGNAQVAFTMRHELFHVLTRANPEIRDRIYSIIGFEPFGKKHLELPRWVKTRLLYNPDAHHFDHFIRVVHNGELRTVVPIQYFEVTRKFLPVEKPFFATMKEDLLVVQENEHSWTAVFDHGRPVILPYKSTDYDQRIRYNTYYWSHPEELSADHFSLIFGQTDRKKVIRADSIEDLKRVLTDTSLYPHCAKALSEPVPQGRVK